MPITLDNYAAGYNYSNTGTPPASPVTFSHTVNSGSNRIILVTIQQRGGTGGNVTGVTYDGVAMAPADTIPVDGAMRTSIWYLEAPSTGSNIVSVSHNCTGGTAFEIQALSFFGVDQTTPINATATAAASNTGPMTATITTTVTDAVIVDSCAMRTTVSAETGTMTAMTNRVERRNATVSPNYMRGMVSTIITATTATGYAMEWTKTYNNSWALMAVALTPATGTTFTTTITGSMSTAGTITKKTKKFFSGVQDGAGIVTKNIQRSIAGVMDMAGTLTKRTLLSFLATMDTSGTLTRKIGKSITALQNMSGTLTRIVRKTFSGSLSMTGILTNSKQYFRTFLGDMLTGGVINTLVVPTVISTLDNLKKWWIRRRYH